MATSKIKLDSIQDNAINAAKIVDGTVVAAEIADDAITTDKIANSAITDAKIDTIAATKLTGSIANARVPASAVTQHVTGYDDASIRSDILKLALHQAIDGNRTAYNLEDSFIDGFEDDTGITTETTVDRNSTGEYVSSTVTTDGHGVTMLYVNPFSTNAYTPTTTPANTTFTANSMVFESSGKDGGCIDNTSGNVQGGTLNLPSTGTKSFCFWVKILVDSGYLTDYRGHSGTPFYAGKVCVNGDYLNGAAQTGDVSISSLTTNTWYHVIQIADASGVRLGSRYATESSQWSAQGHFHYDTLEVYDGTISATNANNVYVGTTTTVNATGTLISDAQTASSSRTSCSGVIIYEDSSGTATLGTDLKIYFTANNGTNWTEAASYGTATTYSGTKKLVKLGATTVTAGTQVALKAVWANQANGSKETRLHGWAVNY